MDDDTRSRLIAATRAHLDEHGLDGLTLREIARACGLSHGAPLRHFAGLTTLLAAVAAEGFDGLRSAIDAAIADVPDDDPLLRLRRSGQAYVAFALAHPGPFELMFRPERLDRDHPAFAQASWESYAQIRSLTAAAQATGWQADVPTDVLTGVLWSSVHGIAVLSIRGDLLAATGGVGVDAFVDAFQVGLAGLPAGSTGHRRTRTRSGGRRPATRSAS